MSNFSDEDAVAAPGLKTLREAIPSHCFKPSLLKSSSYVVRDLMLATALFYAGLSLTRMEPSFLRSCLWTVYGIAQGIVFTGIWVMAHECGHHAYSLHRKTNSVIGYVLHSMILVPFFSWKYSHARHHRYTNHMEKDTVFVPQRKKDFRQSFWTGSFLGHAEDAPLVSLLLLLGHQLLGWPIWLFFNGGAGMKSTPKKDRHTTKRESHIDPGADVFTEKEHPFVLLSNIGILTTLSVICGAARVVGWYNMALLYGIPYLWMNHWLVAITFLHHTHPEVPRYEENTWTYTKGALSTIDRDFGFIGRHIFHGIIEYHVIHHIFPRIPFYYAEEATEAIKPLLGQAYAEQRTNFVWDLWSTFRQCNYVEEHKAFPGIVHWTKGA